MTEVAGKILFPLSANTPLEEPYEARYVHTYSRGELVFNEGTRWERRKLDTVDTSFSARLNRLLCSRHDVAHVEAFLASLVVTQPQIASLDVAVAKPKLTPAEWQYMGVTETGRNAVYLPDSEPVTLWVVAPLAQMESTLLLLMTLARKLPEKPPSVLRNLMASAYLTAWKRQPGNWWKRRLALLSQTGIIDTHLGCLVTFEEDVAAQFEGADRLPPHGSGM